MQDFLYKLPVLAEKEKKKNKEFFARLKKRPPQNLDGKVHQLHEEVFEKINCLNCANCCKKLGPRVTDKDIERISKHLRLSPSDFTEKFLRIDEDNDYVFKSMPCPFLGSDNYCNIYDVRPAACKNYPHTDRKKFIQLLDITLKNTSVCPGVFDIVSGLREEFSGKK